MKINNKRTVSYLGIEGSYSYQAARKLFPDANLKNFRSFADVLKCIQQNSCDIAVIPVENSIAGRVADVHGLLLRTDLLIATEYLLDIKHCLVTGLDRAADVEKFDLSSLTRVISHPQALMQCKDYLSEHAPNAEITSATDTASAVKQVCEKRSAAIAAIGSTDAAQIYGGHILAENIADVQNNTTRFLALSDPKNLSDSDADNMTSLIFQVNHNPGALLKALQSFDKFGVNLTKLETYMVSVDLDYPTFYVDVGAGLNEKPMADALNLLQDNTTYVKLLGTYQAHENRTGKNGFLPIN